MLTSRNEHYLHQTTVVPCEGIIQNRKDLLLLTSFNFSGVTCKTDGKICIITKKNLHFMNTQQ